MSESAPDRFVKVAVLDDVPVGTMRCLVVRDRRILLANVGGEILAADDTCTHEDASLCTGSLNGEYVKCPLHGSRFSLRTGQPVDEPAEERLRTYPVRIEGRDVLLDPDLHQPRDRNSP